MSETSLDRFCRSWFARLIEGQSGGPILYHYSGAQGLLGILGEGGLRATNIAFLNDSTEYYLSLERIGRALARYAQGADAGLAPFIDGMASRLRAAEDSVPPVYVVSFSRVADLLSQWRGYGDAESGYAVGFDLARLAAIGDRPGCLLAPCLYAPDVQDRFADDLVRTVADLWGRSRKGEEERDALLNDAFGRIAWFAPLFKHPGFAEEKEWRLIRLIRPDEVGELRFFSRQTCIATFLQVHFDLEMVREVWVGPSRHQHLSLPAIGALLRQKGYPADVRVVGSSVPFRLV